MSVTDSKPIAADVVTGHPIVIDDETKTTPKYKEPTTVQQLLNMRVDHLREMNRLGKHIIKHLKRPIDADNTIDNTAGRVTRTKRSFDDFLSTELENNRKITRLAGDLVAEVWEYRKELKGE